MAAWRRHAVLSCVYITIFSRKESKSISITEQSILEGSSVERTSLYVPKLSKVLRIQIANCKHFFSYNANVLICTVACKGHLKKNFFSYSRVANPELLIPSCYPPKPYCHTNMCVCVCVCVCVCLCVCVCMCMWERDAQVQNFSVPSPHPIPIPKRSKGSLKKRPL